MTFINLKLFSLATNTTQTHNSCEQRPESERDSHTEHRSGQIGDFAGTTRSEGEAALSVSFQLRFLWTSLCQLKKKKTVSVLIQHMVIFSRRSHLCGNSLGDFSEVKTFLTTTTSRSCGTTRLSLICWTFHISEFKLISLKPYCAQTIFVLMLLRNC